MSSGGRGRFSRVASSLFFQRAEGTGAKPDYILEDSITSDVASRIKVRSHNAVIAVSMASADGDGKRTAKFFNDHTVEMNQVKPLVKGEFPDAVSTLGEIYTPNTLLSHRIRFQNIYLNLPRLSVIC
jgi:hypothetical protein